MRKNHIFPWLFYSVTVAAVLTTGWMWAVHDGVDPTELNIVQLMITQFILYSLVIYTPFGIYVLVNKIVSTREEKRRCKAAQSSLVL